MLLIRIITTAAVIATRAGPLLGGRGGRRGGGPQSTPPLSLDCPSKDIPPASPPLGEAALAPRDLRAADAAGDGRHPARRGGPWVRVEGRGVVLRTAFDTAPGRGVPAFH